MTGRDVKRILGLHDQITRVMADLRFEDGRRNGIELRTLIVAHYVTMYERLDSETAWLRTCERVGVAPSQRRGNGNYKLRDLFSSDAPRYEPPGWNAHATVCPSLMTRGPRTGEPCGKAGSTSFRVTDPATGEWDIAGWCYRHRVDADAERIVERERFRAGFPEPLPNTGGLLPCYIRASNWPDIYTQVKPSWKPPAIGIVADDWPVLAKVQAHAETARARFEVLTGDGEDADVDIPSLRLISTPAGGAV